VTVTAAAPAEQTTSCQGWQDCCTLHRVAASTVMLSIGTLFLQHGQARNDDAQERRAGTQLLFEYRLLRQEQPTHLAQEEMLMVLHSGQC
jgi:hypothetical protein